ncbi:MAG: hypothetical protein D6718_00155 [Acidobacteria bacterium]|nr:MAG: hypothetical protein D6718_00155 [Acidobacteriota bacterium]
MSATEDRQACALCRNRDEADAAAALLSAEGIDVEIAAPGERYHGLPPGCWEVRVPGTQAARARALLDERARRGIAGEGAAPGPDAR